MNALKNFAIGLIALAFSLIGVGADLPFGEVAWKNHVATNGYTTLVSVYQMNDMAEDGLYLFHANQSSQVGSLRFQSYDSFLKLITQELRTAEESISETNGFNPSEPLVVYIATAVWPANSPPHYGINDFILVVNMVPVGDGHWKFPAGFVGSIQFEYNNWQVLPLKKKAVSAKLSYTNRVTGRVDEQDTAGANGFPERLVKVNEQGSVLVHEDFVWGNPDYDLRLTVRYTNGKIETWDENGKEVSIPIPVVPATITMISGESGLQLSLKGTVGQRVTVQRLTAELEWESLRTVVFTNTAITVPYDSGTNEHELFRLTE